MSYPRRLTLYLSALLTTPLLLTPPALAAPFTWTGQGLNNLFTASGNWSPVGQPGAADDVTFATGFASGTNIRIISPTSVRSINVNTTAPFSISPAFIGDGLSVFFGITSTGNPTFNTRLDLPLSSEFSIPSGTVTIANGFNQPSSGTVIKTGIGTLSLSGAIPASQYFISGGKVLFNGATTSGALFRMATQTTASYVQPSTQGESFVGNSSPFYAIESGNFVNSISSASNLGSQLFLIANGPDAVLRVADVRAGTILASGGTGTVEVKSVLGDLYIGTGKLVVTPGGANVPTSFRLFGGTLSLPDQHPVNRFSLGDGTVEIPTGNVTVNTNITRDSVLFGTRVRLNKTGAGTLTLFVQQLTELNTLRCESGVIQFVGVGSFRSDLVLAGGTISFSDFVEPNQSVSVEPAGGDITFDVFPGINPRLGPVSGSGALRVRQLSTATLQITDTSQFSGQLLLKTGSVQLDSGLPALLGGLQLGPGDLPTSPPPTATLTGFVRSTISGPGNLLVPVALQIGTPTLPVALNLDGNLTLSPNAFTTLLSSSENTLGANTTLGPGSGLFTTASLRLRPTHTLSSPGNATIYGPVSSAGNVSGPTTLGSPAPTLTFTGPVTATGNFTGNIQFNALLSPGDPTDPTAALTLADITLTPTSTLLLEIASPTGPGTGYDALTVNTLTLAGTLDLRFLAGFTFPPTPFRFDLITATTALTGQFSTILLPPIPPGDFPPFFLQQTPTSLSLTTFTPIPEPTPSLTALAALTPTLTRRRREGRSLH